jgi:hypothetical protein
VVLLGAHPAKYKPQCVVCAVWRCVRASIPRRMVIIVAVHQDNIVIVTTSRR